MLRWTAQFRWVAIALVCFLLHLFSISLNATIFDALQSRVEVFAVRVQLLARLGFAAFCASAVAFLFGT